MRTSGIEWRGAWCRQRARPLVALLTGAAVMVLSSSAATAMTAVQRDFSELVDRAEEIVEGRVVELHNLVDERGMPRTRVTLAVRGCLKGRAGGRFTIELLGGTVGRAELRVPGIPRFQTGDDVVLFVRDNGRAACPLVGVWQGYFRVRYDSRRAAEVVEHHDGRPATRRDVLADQASGASAALDAPLTLDEFRHAILDRLGAPGPAASGALE